MNIRYSTFQRFIACVLALVLVLGLLPAIAAPAKAAVADNRLNVVAGSKVSDPATLHDWQKYFGPNKLDTEFAGAVWTDKSVFSAESTDLPGVALNDPNSFLIALSAIAANTTITGHATAPTDTMLVLDVSGSMVDDTVNVGYVRQGNSYREQSAIDMSLINAMIESTNTTIDALMTQNPNNRVGVVLYSGNTSTSQAATSDTATVILPLGRYSGVNKEYLSVDATYTTSQLYEYVNTGFGRGYWQSAGQSDPYVTSGSNVSISVKNGLTAEGGASVTDTSKRVNGGTYIQNGLYKALGQFLAVEDTAVPEGKAQAGSQRIPVIVLMSDGAPTIATTNYSNVGDSNVGTGSGTNDRITMLTQLTAAYVKGAVADHYKESATDKQDVLFLTLGLGTSSNAAATDTLYPAGSDTDLVNYWDTYLAATAGSNVTVIPDTSNQGDNSLTVTRNALVTAMNYVDKYYYAADADGMIGSFSEIVSQIQLQAATYTTLVTGGNADFSGYVTFEDELGELMEVTDVKGILIGNALFDGDDIAKDMNSGKLGTPGGSATELGHELVATVKERIPGLTTSQAQQLINAAYTDQQLYYNENDGTWSNYIGWYANSAGEFVGFWDKDSGYENYPADAVYANKSYGYLGANEDSDMMHVVVMVRTNLQTLHQTVVFKIPASLIPTVTYKVTLKEDDSSSVKEFVRVGAEPMRLVFEAGLRSDVNSVNLEQKIQEHLANGGHIHKHSDGTYTFYTNTWGSDNDKDGDNKVDYDEVLTAKVAESHFHPALDNGRFYFLEDTLVLDVNGNPVTGDTQPSGTGYHHNRYIYGTTQRTAVSMPLSAETLAKAQKNAAGQWYIPAGSAYMEWNRFHSLKGGDSNSDGAADKNLSGTLEYFFYPQAFAGADNSVDMYTFLGNNGTFSVAPATGIALTKQVEGTIPDTDTFTFTVSIPAGVNANPIVTDANGDPIDGVTTTTYENNSFQVTMPADVTAYITGIPGGTPVTIREEMNGDYHIFGIVVNNISQAISQSVQVTVPAITATDLILPVTFINAPNGYGDLIIEKDVHHEMDTDPAVLATKVFTFQVTVSGDKIEAGDTFETSAGAKVKVAANGTLTFEDGSAITLHNEESLTIYDLPDGTRYTVAETDIPAGFALSTVNGTAATSASGEIETNGTALAAFVNTYPASFQPVNVPLNLTVNKDLDLRSTPTNPETFKFILEQLVGGSYSTVDDTLQIASDAANKTVSKQIPLSFNAIGTYHYRLTEVSGNTPGMTYSTTRALFSVVVTDDDMDGTLEVAIIEEANIDASATYTDSQNHETITGMAAEATFTNVFQLHSTHVAVNVHKNLVNNTGVEIPLSEFQFGLYAVDASGNATGNPIQTITAGSLGDATFNILITQEQDLTYIIKEIVPVAPRVGMTYDPAEYVLTIDVTTAPDGQLSAVTSTVRKGETTETAVAFTNTYALTPTTVSFPWSKTLNGLASVPQAKQFEFVLYRTDDTYQKLDPAVDANAYTAFYSANGTTNANITIDKKWVGGELVPVIDKVGTYHYKMVETIPAANDAVQGLTYDSSEYHISFTVTDNGNGALVASTPVIHKVGQTAPVNTAAFVNTYTVSGSGTVVIDGTKALDGRAPVPGEFLFGLYADLNAAPIRTAVNRADGTFAFEALEFTPAQLGANNATAVYTYYIKEILPDGVDSNNTLGGVKYDTTVHTVTVTVSHDGAGNLVVTPSNNHTGTIQINNTYSAEGVDVTLHGNKNLVGDWSAVTNKTFTFELYEADENFQVTNNTPVTKTNAADGTFSFDLSYADGQEGYHYYILREARPQDGRSATDSAVHGVTYDATIFRITVSVTDPGNGKLAALVSMYHPGTGEVANDPVLHAPVAVFNNRYSVTSTQVTLAGTKVFTDVDTQSNKTMADGDFTFVILENGKLVTDGANKADGTIEFKPITYTAAGTHTYTVVEVTGNAGGVTYDDAEFTVTVTVTDNGDGTLSTDVDYVKPIRFENTYDADAAVVTIEGKKELTGRQLKENEFTFQLLQNGTVIQEKKNAANGAVVFDAITYTAAGTYTYTLQEVKGTETGVTYDSTVYTVTVTVTDNGEGTLFAAVAYSAEAVFRNTYKAPDIPVTGDSFNLLLCGAILVFSTVSMLTLIVLKKKYAV